MVKEKIDDAGNDVKSQVVEARDTVVENVEAVGKEVKDLKSKLSEFLDSKQNPAIECDVHNENTGGVNIGGRGFGIGVGIGIDIDGSGIRRRNSQ